MQESNPGLADSLSQCIDGTRYYTDGIGGQIDLAHLAATIEGYLSHRFPVFWTGWGGDLASGIVDDIDGRDGADASLATAYAFIGGDSSRAKCNCSDLCVDADAIGVSSLIASSTETLHPLSQAMQTYYTTMVDQRYLLYSQELGCSNDVVSMKAAVRSKMEEPAAVSLGTIIVCDKSFIGENN